MKNFLVFCKIKNKSKFIENFYKMIYLKKSKLNKIILNLNSKGKMIYNYFKASLVICFAVLVLKILF